MLPQEQFSTLPAAIPADFKSPLTPYFTYGSRVKADSLQAFPKYHLSIALFTHTVNAQDVSFFRFVITEKRLQGYPKSVSPTGATAPEADRLRAAAVTAFASEGAPEAASTAAG